MFKKYYCLSFLIFSFSLLVTRSGFAQSAMLSKGDAAPVFTAKASLAGSAFNFSLKDAIAKGPVLRPCWYYQQRVPVISHAPYCMSVLSHSMTRRALVPVKKNNKA